MPDVIELTPDLFNKDGTISMTKLMQAIEGMEEETKKEIEYECKICGKDLWGDDPSDDPPVSEFCSNDCHIIYLEAMIMRLDSRLDNHIKNHDLLGWKS